MPNNVANTSTRIDWINSLKFCTMLLVLIGHCNYLNVVTQYGGLSVVDEQADASISYRLIDLLVRFIYTFHMPLFIAISGMCFFYSSKKLSSVKDLIVTKWKRLIVPFIGVTMLYSVPIKFSVGYWSQSDNILSDIVNGHILLRGNSHLWFLVALFWIFLIFYFLEKQMRNHTKNIVYWLGLLLLSWVGYLLDTPSRCFLGLFPAFKLLFFFALGYSGIEHLAKRTTFPTMHILAYVPFIVVLFISSVALPRYLDGLLPNVLIYLLRCLFFTTLAITNSLFFIFIVRKFNSSIIRMGGANIIQRAMFGRTFELYLYSDPLNYIVIYLCYIIWGNSILTCDLASIGVFLVRLLVSILVPLLIVKMIKSLKQIVK